MLSFWLYCFTKDTKVTANRTWTYWIWSSRKAFIFIWSADASNIVRLSSKFIFHCHVPHETASVELLKQFLVYRCNCQLSKLQLWFTATTFYSKITLHTVDFSIALKFYRRIHCYVNFYQNFFLIMYHKLPRYSFVNQGIFYYSLSKKKKKKKKIKGF